MGVKLHSKNLIVALPKCAEILYFKTIAKIFNRVFLQILPCEEKDGFPK